MLEQADTLVEQFRETAEFRRRALQAVAVMHDPVHIVVGAGDELDAAKALGDFKSWGTRTPARRFVEPGSQTWWTERGAKRRLPDERAIAAAVR